MSTTQVLHSRSSTMIKGTALLLSAAASMSLFAQPAIPTASIAASVTPTTPIAVGQTATVTLRMVSYNGQIEVEGFELIVNYSSSVLAFVPDSLYFGPASGIDQQWLSMAPQESAADGYGLTNIFNTVQAGTIYIGAADLKRVYPERGTLASAGFLLSFQVRAIASGVANVSVSPWLDGSVLLNTSLRPVPGAVQFSGATISVREPGTIPIVSITSPAGGAFFHAPDKIAISASAAVTNGTITRMEFYTDSTNKLGEVTNAPYALDWNYPPNGSHTLTAIATDNLGASGSSAPVPITINSGPGIAITNPANGATFSAPVNLAIQATASDNDGGVARVEFYSGATLLNTDSNTPFAFTWSGVATGSYTLTARAVDSLGAVTVSSPVSVTVRPSNGPPNIVAAGTLQEYESGPVTGGLDPGETATLRLYLRNVGGSDTANLTATLQISGGVTYPSGAQTFGILPAGGPAAGLPFTFTVYGTNGGVVTATWLLQDGSTSLGSVVLTFGLGKTATFVNQGVINIPTSGAATPYPSTIPVTGLSNLVNNVTVTLSNLTHGFPDDIDALLVSPGGRKTMLLSDAGGGTSITTPVTLVLDDTAASSLPDSSTFGAGTYKPTDYATGDTMPASAPAGPYASTLGTFKGSTPGGTWSLYVADDTIGDDGRINGGWHLTLSTFDPVNPVSDLAVAVTDTPDPAGLGSNLTYTVTVTNLGPEYALNVTLTNTLPSGVNFVSAAPSQGSCTNVSGKVTCDLGALATNANATITLVVNITATGTKTLTASVGGPVNDFNSANNSATAATAVNGAADLALILIDSPDPVSINSTITYALNVTNKGPNTASTVTLTNVLPPGVAFVSATPSQGSCSVNGSIVTCNLGSLASAAQATVTITGTAPGTPGILTDTAGAWAATPADQATSNNIASAVTTNRNPSFIIVPATAILTSESGPITGGIEPGETVSMNFLLKNIGSANTANLVGTLQASGGVTSPSGAQSYGVLTANGAAVSRAFTFSASGAATGLLTATLTLQDGAVNLGAVSYTFPLGNAYRFANANALSIPDYGAASPYPSTIVVSGLAGGIRTMSVTLSNLTHTYPSDLDVLLVAPGGQSMLILSDCGGGSSITNVTVTLDDGSAYGLPGYGIPIITGSYRPLDLEPGDVLPAPAPSGPYANNLSLGTGLSPNGVWSLYVADDSYGDSGALTGGWSLNFSTVGLVTPLSPALLSCTVNANQQFEFVLQGQPGDTYQIDASTDLITWTCIRTNTLVTETLTITDPSGTANPPTRFYRAWRRP